MNPSARRAAALLAVAGTLSLAGCSFAVGTDPVRDGETGEIVETNAAADVFSLQVGDCLAFMESDGELSSVPVVPCSDPHADEVYYAHDFADGEYPGDDAVFEEAAGVCVDEFEAFVGVAYDDSALDVYPIYPTADSWAQGDREALCLVYDPAGDVTGTLAGAAR
ncbi:septum formation family protein [Microbacter sp. GSS18]|nr:septum formation family protein [Microbacter sp. GSS18]